MWTKGTGSAGVRTGGLATRKAVLCVPAGGGQGTARCLGGKQGLGAQLRVGRELAVSALEMGDGSCAASGRGGGQEGSAWALLAVASVSNRTVAGSRGKALLNVAVLHLFSLAVRKL